MARYVDADAAIEVQMYDEEHEDFYTEKMTVEDFICRYSEMPPIIDEPHWIPCSERFPDDNATVLITHRGGVSFGWYNGRYWERGANTKHRPLQTVTAWMPLPKPYEVEE